MSLNGHDIEYHVFTCCCWAHTHVLLTHTLKFVQVVTADGRSSIDNDVAGQGGKRKHVVEPNLPYKVPQSKGDHENIPSNQPAVIASPYMVCTYTYVCKYTQNCLSVFVAAHKHACLVQVVQRQV